MYTLEGRTVTMKTFNVRLSVEDDSDANVLAEALAVAGESDGVSITMWGVPCAVKLVSANTTSTSGGVELTPEVLDSLTEEAEADYDVNKLRPRRKDRYSLNEVAAEFGVDLDDRKD
jgi:hypothetical protein